MLNRDEARFVSLVKNLHQRGLSLFIGSYFDTDGDFGPSEMTVCGQGHYEAVEIVDHDNLATTLAPILKGLVK